MIAELLTLAALTWQDPSGDAHGAGDLAPPTAAAYSSLAPFDLVQASVLDDVLLIVEVRLAGIPDPGGLPNGLTLPVLDVYLDTDEGGREELLPGPDMAMPAGRGWELALRVHGDDAYLVDAGEPDGRPRPLTVTRRGDVLRLETGLARPQEIRDLHALTGVYDPFRNDAWRPLAATASPWAFASETPAPPVVDLLADDDAAQRDALRAFRLPARRTRSGSVPWLVLMLAGLGVAIVGLGLRRRVPVEGTSGDAETATAHERSDADAADAADARAPVPADEDAIHRDAAAAAAPSSPGADGAETPVVGRASRRSRRAPRADDDGGGDDDGDGARVLRTTWAGRDGWWVEDPGADDAPRETLWDAATKAEGGAEEACATGQEPAPTDREPTAAGEETVVETAAETAAEIDATTVEETAAGDAERAVVSEADAETRSRDREGADEHADEDRDDEDEDDEDEDETRNADRTG